jgi:protocatechuate 3,4-dioxygenase alpha subunit
VAQGLPTTPSQTVGPFFAFLVHPGSEEVVAPGSPGAIRLEGRVLDGDGIGVPDALIEVWQADPAGRYPHPDDPRHAEVEAGFHGFARSGTDGEGRYSFVTVVPGPVPAAGGAQQAPHLAMSVFARGLLDRVITRVYFPVDGVDLATDPVFGAVDADRRETLVARAEPDRYVFDVHLQGEGETVFFDV